MSRKTHNAAAQLQILQPVRAVSFTFHIIQRYYPKIAFTNTAKLAATFLATRPLKSLLSLAAKSIIKLTYQLLNALNAAVLVVVLEVFKLFF